MTGGRRLLLGLITALFVLGGFATTAAAQQSDDTEDEGQTEDEGASETARGVLVDRNGTRERDDDEPVSDVEIIVTGPDGFSESVTSDDEGRFEVDLPGEGEYVAELNADTLPDDVEIAEEDEQVEFFVRPNQARVLLFELGARERNVTSDLDQGLQLAFEGVKFGLIIAITAVGLSLIFGTTGLTNFAHGELVTFGAIVAWWINVDGGLHLIPATVLAMMIGGLGAGLLDLGMWRPLRRRGMSLLAMMVVSIGLSLFLRNFFQLLFGETTQPYNDYAVQSGVDIGPIRAAPKDLWSIGIILVVMVLVALVLQRTRFGKATRAVSDSPDLAASSGIDVNRVIFYVWVMGGALATLGGVLFGMGERVGFGMGFNLLLLMFAGITLGGLGTAYGALLGSFVVGFLVNVSTLWISPELKNIGALVVLILVLMVRPQGILGRAERVG